MSPPEGKGRLPYWLRFASATAILLGVTAVLVLVVMPQRFVLEAGFRESGITFPSSRVGFRPPEPATLVQPPPPPPPRVEPEEGPAERLWAEIDPLLASGHWSAALARMESYLEAYPDDLAVRRERARTLARLGRTDAAIAAWRDIVARTDAPADRLALARTLRDGGDAEGAISLYRALVAARPADRALRAELARTLLWAERYPEAEVALRALLAEDPTDDISRLDLARALYWGGRPAEARVVLASLDTESPLAPEARLLDAELASVLAPPPAPVAPEPTPVERARLAAAGGDLEEAARRYEAALERDPADRALWVEWVDFLQFRLEDPAATRDALLLFSERFDLTADERLRLAQLHAWTGQEAEAEAILLALLAEDPDRADAASLLGDLRRWRGDAVAASEAYREALEADPGSERARAGLDSLRVRRERLVAAREPRGFGPGVFWFADSDDFVRLDVAGDADFTWSVNALKLRAGYRRLEGYDPLGAPATDQGGFVQAEYARWWREAGLRTALRVGGEHLDGFGFEPGAALEVEAPDVGGFALTGLLETSPAYPLTATYESVAEPVRADRLEATAFRSLGDAWSIGAALDGALLSGGGATNPRWAGWVTLSRALGRWLRLDVATSVVGFGEAAPAPAGRRLYWDPRLFWATTASLGAASIPEQGWGWRLRATGGAAYADERDAIEPGWFPQFGVEGGLLLRGEHRDVTLDAFYRRGREEEYASWGLELGVLLRP